MSFNKSKLYLLVSISALLLSACSETNEQGTDFAHLERAAAYQDRGQYKAATIEYKNAVKKSGADASAAVQYADMMNDLGHYAEALNLLEQVSGNKDKAYFVELIETYQGLQKYRSANDIIKKHLPTEDKETKHLSANVFLGLGELEQAELIYQKLLDRDVNDYRAMLGKATALIRRNQTDASLKMIEQIDPKSEFSVKSRILKAGIQINQEKLELAEGTLSDILSNLTNTDIIEPDKATVLERLSYVLTRQGRSNEAYIYTKLLSEAFPGSNEVKEKYQLAIEKLQNNELEAAKEILLDILSDYPNYKQGTQLLGVISYLQGDNESASTYLSESVDPEVANEITKHIYAATNLKLNDPKKVIEILEPGIDKTKVPATLALYGLAAISDKQYAKGEAALLKVIEIDQKNIQVRLALANFYRDNPRPDQEKEWEQLHQAYKIESENKQTLKSIVSFHLKNKNVEKAEAFLSESLLSHPKSFSVNLIAGYFALNQKQPTGALGYFGVAAENVDKTSNDYLNALFAKGKTEISLKKFDEADKTFEELIHIFPENELGYKGLLSVYIMNGDEEAGRLKLINYAKRNARAEPYLVLVQSLLARKDVTLARKYIDEIRTINQNHPSLDGLENAVRYISAIDAMQLNDYSGARKIIANILTTEPDNLRVLSFMVDLEIKAGKLQEASKVLNQIESIDAAHPVIALLKGEIAMAGNDLEGAVSQFGAAWSSNPSESSADKLFKVLSASEDTNALSKHLSNWLARFPDSPNANLYQAITHQQRGQRIKAVEGYQKVLNRLPNNVTALNNLGWLYFEKKDERALALLERAVKISPDSPAILDSYGWVLVQNGHVKDGITYLEKAHKLAPQLKEIEEHLKSARAM